VTLVFVFVILVGAVFGMRLKVMVLVPATIIACGLVIAAGLSGGSTTGAMALAAAALAVCLQIGYVGGSATRMFIAASRIHRPSIPDSLTPPNFHQVAGRIDRLT